jgi:hypothetical protein
LLNRRNTPKKGAANITAMEKKEATIVREYSSISWFKEGERLEYEYVSSL